MNLSSRPEAKPTRLKNTEVLSGLELVLELVLDSVQFQFEGPKVYRGAAPAVKVRNGVSHKTDEGQVWRW